MIPSLSKPDLDLPNIVDHVLRDLGAEADFELQLDACINAMSQDDAIGQTLVFERMSGTLHMRHISIADLVETDINRYEMVVFDGGNTCGDCWKHVFFPRQRTHCFVYENF
ncbi:MULTISPECIES: uridylate kinase [Pseudomonadota]|uniref:uridylate kinase n=1 Tax=Pseudomonadota TaxID=1224 RepID=UPI001114CB78|nr:MULTISPECIES: uridylate kinase [Pseudomonadota]MBX6319625.1 uridylate kinase [Pigmentiphaga sp.]